MKSRSRADAELPPGKLEPELLQSLLPRTTAKHGVHIGAAIGEDAAVIETPATIVVTADPITFATTDPGHYAVAVNCNDIVAMGGMPRYFTATILLPIGTTRGGAQRLFKQLQHATDAAGIAWIGGHTEVSASVTASVVCGCAIGVLAGRPWSSAGVQTGDTVVISKWAGLEGSTLLAHERPERLGLRAADALAVRRWLQQPGIDILAEGRALAGLPLSAAHDPTEGGVAQGLHEMALRSGIKIRLQREHIPVRLETARLCATFGIDPLGLLASGALLFTAPPLVADQALHRLAGAGIPAAVIGVAEAGSGVTICDGSGEHPLPTFVQDEVVRALEV